ncbi:hypothetical protein ACIOD2_20645 [Amycolatopsis sp. NPDC088138]|uniref:hypothetical protein n=1 Tax=Amycolatopsis sp. NPDC088138 TaxID=3363938 RepID=UPI0038115AC4
MSWQEELRRLDADLAAGRIEPADHRRQREELLAQVSGSTAPSPVPAPLRRPSWHSTNPAHPVTPVNPVSAARPPAIPPSRVEVPWARKPNPAGPRPHQVPATSGVPALPDHMTTAPSPADITPTRYLAVEGRVDGSTSRFPPIGPPGTASPPERDAAPADSGRHRDADGKRPTWLFLGLGVLVVLALIVGATMWLGSDEPTADNQPTSPSIVPSAPSGVLNGVEDRLPELPGTQNTANSTMSLDRAVELGVLEKPSAEVLRKSGATEVVFRGSAVEAGSNLVLVAPTPKAANAEAAVEQLYRSALSNGFAEVQADLRTAVGSTGDTQVRATWYTSGGMIVNVGVSQPKKKSDTPLTARLDQLVMALRAVLPPG